ncbi:D-alanyl-D-alanine carboxypeptidase family protein [Patulibacter brassicae]|uniref:D-alanyl-D-alanine carboxypeptidase family protein n=1 Tax=Patulibacter brassicae TaxID=1705717 RepID=A0ABU4VHJ6_9ACTN|nr:D-alanyl-D-alanine carboxypeptidase family protein [Patulibacter brassicae]MDX8150900.1 D-alanyl-D-alanine carboxypeptidase family protein [Patulibacter brassicae]
MPVVVALAVAALTGPAVSPAAAADDPPRISAPAAIAVETSTGDVVFDRRGEQPRAIASTTKLMTALLAFESGNLERRVTIRPYAGAAVESVAGLHPGDRMTLRDLLSALMLPSGNDAAVAIARAVSGSVPAFVRRMNARSRELGLTAEFENPIGLDGRRHRASAADLVKLALLLRRYPEFRRIVNRPSDRLASATPPITVVNRNALVRDVPWVDGVKTGHTTRAGYALVASGRRRGISVVTVVLGTSSEAARDADSLALLRYALGRYRVSTGLAARTVVARLPLRYRDEEVALVAASTVRRITRRDERLTTRVVGTPADVEGPLPAGSRLGTVEVLQRGRVVARVPAVTQRSVAQATVWQRADDQLAKTWVKLVLLLAILCALALAVAVRRQRPPASPAATPATGEGLGS